MFGRKILILVAHPDDEVVACAASIARARAAGADIYALYLTHGCIARASLWPWQRKYYGRMTAVRRVEAEAAAALLNITPVGWAERPARHLWRELPDVLGEVERAVTHLRPDQLWVPAYEGGNPDHDALNAVGFKMKSRVSVLEFAEYNFFGGKTRSQHFISSDETVRTITLTPDERALKRKALDLYASERTNLFYVERDQESYRPLTTYDYNHPPHQGTLWYMRFQWVPFAHPRVDFTKPSEVSAAMGQFLNL